MITREDCFKVGEVAKTHNLQGEVVITTDSDLLEKYADEPVFLLLDGAPVPFFIADEGLTVSNHNSYIVIVKLTGNDYILRVIPFSRIFFDGI